MARGSAGGGRGGMGGGGRGMGGGGRSMGGGFGSGSRSGGSGFSSRGSSGAGRSGGSIGRGSAPGSYGRGSSGGMGGGGRGHMGGGHGHGHGYRPPPVHHHHPPRHRVHIHHHGPRRYYRFGHRHVGGGCLTTIMSLMIAVVVIVAIIVLSLTGGGKSGGGSNAAGGGGGSLVTGSAAASGTVTRSTIERARIRSSNWSLGIYDELDWLNAGTVSKGLKSFWEKTGVVPYIMILDVYGELYNSYGGDLEALAQEEYDYRITHEDGLLFVIATEDGSYDFEAYMQPGYSAMSVMDMEAQDILSGNFLNWWSKDPNRVTESDVFSGAFADAGKQMMKVSKPAWIIVVVAIAAVIIVIVAFNFWKKKRELDAESAEATQKILDAPLGTIPTGGDDTAKKYL